MCIYIYICVYGIHHWRIFRSSYRKLAWAGFDPPTFEFCSDALTNWAIRPWVKFALRANFVQLLQFDLFVQCSRFISVFAFVSRHICSNILKRDKMTDLYVKVSTANVKSWSGNICLTDWLVDWLIDWFNAKLSVLKEWFGKKIEFFWSN